MDLFAKVYLRGLRAITEKDILNLSQNTTCILIGELDTSNSNILINCIKRIHSIFNTPFEHTVDDKHTMFYTSMIYQGHLVILNVTKHMISGEANIYLHHSPSINSSIFDELINKIKGE